MTMGDEKKVAASPWTFIHEGTISGALVEDEEQDLDRQKTEKEREKHVDAEKQIELRKRSGSGVVVAEDGAERRHAGRGEEETRRKEVEHTSRARKVKIPLKPVAFREAVSTLSSPATSWDR